MTTEQFVESAMSFGPYPEGHCFYIEKSNIYKNLGHGVKIVEFVLLRQKSQSLKVCLVEAKSSAPRPENKLDFDNYICEIKEKLVNALTLVIASCLKRHKSAETELPELFKMLDLKNSDFQLILIINGHSESWLPPLLDALKIALHPTVKTWGLSAKAVAVINDKMAVELGLVALVIVQPNRVSLWSAATRRRFPKHTATSRRTPHVERYMWAER